MTPSKSSNRQSAPRLIRFADFEISWVGGGPRANLLCFGSEDGRLRFATTANVGVGTPVLVIDSNEAINEVAFHGRSGAVTTRSEVVQFKLSATMDALESQAVCPIGAHGVIAAGPSQFVAPVGRNGLLVWKLGTTDIQPPIILSPNPDDPYYFYRVISPNAAGRPNVFVSATRPGGVAATTFRPGSGVAETCSFTFPGLDVIDVCALGSDGGLAIAALGVDCTLVFSHDAQSDRRPISFKLNGVKGTAYSLFSARGHLFLLTSRGLYVLRGLARRFLDGEPIERQSTVVSEIPLEAVDANLIGDRWLPVVMTDHTLLYDVEQLVGLESNGKVDGMVQEIVPSSIRTDSETRQTALPAAAA